MTSRSGIEIAISRPQNRMSHRSRTFLRRSLRGAGLAAIVAMSACSSAAHDPIPVASLATTTPAQLALRGILDDWARSSRTERVAMKARIQAYSKQFRTEPPALMAETLLAWVTLDEGYFAQAEALAAVVQVRAAAGTTNESAPRGLRERAWSAPGGPRGFAVSRRCSRPSARADRSTRWS
jgi:hypothetical protein